MGREKVTDNKTWTHQHSQARAMDRMVSMFDCAHKIGLNKFAARKHDNEMIMKVRVKGNKKPNRA